MGGELLVVKGASHLCKYIGRAKHDRSRYLVLTNKSSAVMLRPCTRPDTPVVKDLNIQFKCATAYYLLMS